MLTVKWRFIKKTGKTFIHDNLNWPSKNIRGFRIDHFLPFFRRLVRSLKSLSMKLNFLISQVVKKEVKIQKRVSLKWRRQDVTLVLSRSFSFLIPDK